MSGCPGVTGAVLIAAQGCSVVTSKQRTEAFVKLYRLKYKARQRSTKQDVRAWSSSSVKLVQTVRQLSRSAVAALKPLAWRR